MLAALGRRAAAGIASSSLHSRALSTSKPVQDLRDFLDIESDDVAFGEPGDSCPRSVGASNCGPQAHATFF